MGHRVYFEGVDSIHGFQSRMFQLIEQQIPLERIVMVYKAHDDQDVYDETKVRLINYDMCEHNRDARNPSPEGGRGFATENASL